MKKRILTILITLAMAMGMISAATTTVFAAATFKSGTWGEYEIVDGVYKYTYADFSPFVESDKGTMNNPYVIDSPSQLAALAALVNAYKEGSDVKLTGLYGKTATATNFYKDYASQYIELTANIDLSGLEWVPIGADSSNAINPSNTFQGNFDGKGHTVSGMAIGTADAANEECQYAGLFGYMSAGSIKNLSVSGLVNVNGSRAGGIVGYANAITIENCSSTVCVTASSTGTAYAGGLVGQAANVTIANCYSAGSVNGTTAGGLVGNVGSAVTINHCYWDMNSASESIGQGQSDGSPVKLAQEQMQAAEGTSNPSWESLPILNDTGSLVDALNKYVEDNNSTATLSPWHIHDGEYPTLGVGETITPNTDGQTHTVTCGCNISKTEDHSGGTATCIKRPVCKCGAEYGTVDPNNHDDGANYDANGFCAGGCYQPAVDSDSDGYYEISNAGQLYWFAKQVNSGNTINGKLTANIVINENVLAEMAKDTPDTSKFRAWTPIGKLYEGTFNGNGFTISGIYFNNNETSSVGLFGSIAASGKVTNVGVIDSFFSAYKDVGGVVGYNSGIIENCHNSGSITGVQYVGGVVGCNKATVTGCYNTGTIHGADSIGGVVGQMENAGTVQDCYNTGNVSGSPAGNFDCSGQIGGVIGNIINGSLSGCYNTGSVTATGTGNYDIGGVAGVNRTGGSIVSCYNVGSITGDECVGGVVGSNTGTATNCYYLADSETDSIDGTTFKTSAQFASGEVAYLLNGNQNEIVWYQTCGTGLPAYSGDTVYKYTDCDDVTAIYTNDSSLNGTAKAHIFTETSNGFCTECNGYQPATDSDGDGYYEISNAGQLYWFAQQVNGGNTAIKGKLMKDIVVNEGTMTAESTTARDWTPIGNETNGFSGTFDGNGKTVSGLYLNNSSANSIGLFGYVSRGTVKNLTVSNSFFNGNQNVGGVVGYLNNGTVENCTNYATVSGTSSVGGIVGYCESDAIFENVYNISDCYNNGTVSAGSHVGGIIGECKKSSVSACYNFGNVSGTSSVGGVVGQCNNNSSVSGCINNKNVSGTGFVGGVVGLNVESTVKNCYSDNCTVSGTRNVGGIVGGIQTYGEVSHCYNESDVSSTYSVGGVIGNSSNGSVSYCYNTGNVSGTQSVGGVVAISSGGITNITNCYNTGNVSGETNVGGVFALSNNSNTNVTNCYNTGNVSGETNVGSVFALSNDSNTNVTNCYYLADSETDSIDGTTFKTSAQFASGEVAYLLNNGVNDGSQHFYQFCGTGVPNFDFRSDNTVYKATKGCTGAYVNDPNAEPKHTFTADSNGFCAACGSAYLPAVDSDSDGYYEISNAGQLYWFAQQVNGGSISINGKLTANIVVNENVLTESGELSGDGSNFRVWTPIGISEKMSYTGTFDGNGKTVSGLYFNNEGQSFVGLFGWVGDNGTINNVGIIDSYFHCYDDVGGVVGYNRGEVSGCYNKGTVSGTYNVGGVVGRNHKASTESVAGTVINCYNMGKVSGTVNMTGGVVGDNQLGIISGCYNNGAVSGNENVGGVAGQNNTTYNLTNCYNTGNVSGTTKVGGIVGSNLEGTIENCYNTGFISGISNYVGGIAGKNEGKVTNCYYLSGHAVDGSATVQLGIGNETAGSSTADEAGKTTGKFHAQFASGEVAYLLNGDQSEIVWYQTCGEGLPAFSGNRVYRNQLSGCSEATFKYEYSNEQKAPVTTHDTTKYVYAEASIVNSITATCGDCQAANWTVTLAAPENAVYNGQLQGATVTGKILGVSITVDYDKAPINVGTYKASVTLGGVEVSIEYKIEPKVLVPTITGRVTKVYDGTNTVPAGLSIVLEGIVGADNVTASAIYTFDSPAAGTTKVNAECILLNGENVGNYTLSASTASADVGEITKAPSRLITAPTAIRGLVYDKQAHPLVTPGAAEFGTFVYSFDCMNWSASIPTAVNAGSYTVFYKVAGDQNHLDTAPAVITVSVAQREIGIIWGQTAFDYNGSRQAPTATATGLLPGDVCTVGTNGWGIYDGTYTITARSLSNPNYKLPAAGTSCQFTITTDYDKESDKVMDAVGDAVSDAANEVYEDYIAPAITNAFNQMLENLFKMFENLFN